MGGGVILDGLELSEAQMKEINDIQESNAYYTVWTKKEEEFLLKNYKKVRIGHISKMMEVIFKDSSASFSVDSLKSKYVRMMKKNNEVS